MPPLTTTTPPTSTDLTHRRAGTRQTARRQAARRMAALAGLTLAALSLGVLAGCGRDAAPGSTTTSSPSATPDEALSIPITIQGDSVTPNGDRIAVAVGQAVTLVVNADAPGEIHVHSTPEQEFEYPAGTTALALQPITVPGIVDVESHTLDKTIVQLEVR